ncbi:uncharacterized protein LOC129939369 [Eupeodes corollae]|uniref:uncharacterized protein LOC129939369 n=1 Tax=Eupeodes corollae TaxID=290404 RepID=UPI00248FC456|nr:uncharacterized protein LOC129939369 [Eupeodes corollae]
MSGRKEISSEVRKIVIKLKNEGMSMAKIGKSLDLSKASVQTIIKNYNETGHYDSRPRSGRPRKLDDRTMRKVVRKVVENPKQSAIKLAAELQSFESITVHPETVRRVLKRSGLSSRVARKKPLISSKNRIKRLEYAKKYDPTF